MKPFVLLVLLAGCGVRDAGISVEVSLTPRTTQRFDEATLAIEHLELFPCTTAWGRWALIGGAWAHGAHDGLSPLELEPSALIDLTRPELQVVGTLHPPPGTYCSLTLGFAPSTAEASTQGTTLYLQRKSGDQLRQLSTKRLTLPLALDHITLDEAHLQLTLAAQLELLAPASTGDETLEALLRTIHR